MVLFPGRSLTSFTMLSRTQLPNVQEQAAYLSGKQILLLVKFIVHWILRSSRIRGTEPENHRYAMTNFHSELLQ